MEYSGPLFGKVGRRFILLRLNSEDVDRMTLERSELLEALEAQESAEKWMLDNDPNEPFYDETVRLKLDYAADLRCAAIAKAKGETK